MTEEDTLQQTPRSEAILIRRRRIWPTMLLGAVILFSGMAIGSGITLLWLQRSVLHMLHHPEEAPAAITVRLRSKFNLTDDQAKRVEEVLRERQKSLQMIRREVQPRVTAELEKVRLEVAEALTPEQAKEWNAYFETMQKRWLPSLPPGPAESPDDK